MTLKLEEYQSKLFPYAYNILGSSEDARDVVQDVILGHISTQQQGIENVMAYLVKTVINRSINLKKRRSRTTDMEVWLPEPISTEQTDTSILKEEIISYSLLVMLEKLSPRERAVFMLKEGFDYAHDEVAELLDISIDNSRKILSRAKARLQQAKSEIAVKESDYSAQYLENYIEILKNGDVTGLEYLLTEDIAVMADGGREINVVRSLTMGRMAAMDLLFYVYKAFQKQQRIVISEVNHQPALFYYEDENLVNCQVFELAGNKVNRIFSIVDPHKLNHLRS